MTTKSKTAASKGAAVRAEKDPQLRELEWRGLTLTLPAAMPTMGLTAAWRRLSKAAEAEDGQAAMGYLVDMVDVLVGGNERLSDQVWAKIDADGGDEFDAVLDLIDQAGAVYGVEPGESTASP